MANLDVLQGKVHEGRRRGKGQVVHFPKEVGQGGKDRLRAERQAVPGCKWKLWGQFREVGN